MRNLLIRADANPHIGTGHVMRCVTLANSLKEKGTQSLFICREHVGNIRDRIEREGLKALSLPSITHNDHQKNPDPGLPPHAAWLGCDWELDAHQTIEWLSYFKPDWLVIDHW